MYKYYNKEMDVVLLISHISKIVKRHFLIFDIFISPRIYVSKQCVFPNKLLCKIRKIYQVRIKI